jgi:hypothetical protein
MAQRSRDYYEKNKEKLSESVKKYHETNKEKIYQQVDSNSRKSEIKIN